MYALTNCRFYTGYEILENHAAIIDGDRITKICKQDELPADITIENLQGAIVAPGFIDIQVNGCGGVQFNETLDALSIDTLESMQATNLVTGCTSYLPTLITSSDEFMIKAVTVMREYLATHANQALGLHLEGPYINPEKKGIHDENFIRQPSQKMIDFLCENADVIKIITLAPEKVESHFIKQLVNAGIHVSVGHSNGHYDDCRRGFNDGIRLGTHLFNAMPYISGREPGVVGAIYDAPEVYVGIIADGQHVNWANIRNSHKIKQDHLILITDAMLLAGSNLSSGVFAGKTIYYKDGRCIDEKGTLGGSALTMIEAVKNAVEYVGIALDEALRMATLYPARAIGVDKELGSICEGNIANLVIFDRNYTISKTIVNGVMSR
ncbi:N-acetylglucosamine-6-phosphate deacetylase [Gilliamella sp. wkB108]|uniref:N-acetylglucosamine-6-phosphate deacetylase n=1 Tax=Gilliamella sp. wkB108 TaxID=3120256 RepID=UPI00080DA821|nr:N-acetylglucosamine-6-phosphate deacetylase [Gilliamella apicola]OCG27891.1 N-acetylglucosamine-6-phosphate deacetylase [Gilliamella apicola]